MPNTYCDSRLASTTPATGKQVETQRRASAACFIILTLSICAVPAQAQRPIQLLSQAPIGQGISHSIYALKTGNGAFDQIRLHRVVREQNGRAIATKKAILLVHGDVWGFEPAFLPADSPLHSLPFYLASQGADVWGVDLAWTLVPESTTDFGFMRNWGLQHDIDDVTAALDTAEEIRKDNDGLAVLGWSRGASILYGLINQESQLPPSRRRVKAAIPFDGGYKYTDGRTLAFACEQAAAETQAYAQGQFGSDVRIWRPLGTLAEMDPNGASPLFGPPYTNRTALMQIGAAAFALFGPSFAPQYHFVAGVFPNDDFTQIPTDLAYTDVPRFARFARSGSSYMPRLLLKETYDVSCSSGPSGKFDKHLSDIRVPMMYVAARGGFGDAALAMRDVVGSPDEQTLSVQLRPEVAPGLDFGHVDLLHARNAQGLVWSAIDSWLTAHAND